jgi:hypothetical protein
MKGIHFYLLPVIVAAIVQWVIGAIWYGIGFRKRWIALVGSTGEGKPGRAVFEMFCSFVMSIILSFVLANVIVGFGNLLPGGSPGFQLGASIAIVCWFGFIAPTMLTQHMFERRPANLFAINAGYWVVAMAISGGVLGVMAR